MQSTRSNADSDASHMTEAVAVEFDEMRGVEASFEHATLDVGERVEIWFLLEELATESGPAGDALQSEACSDPGPAEASCRTHHDDVQESVVNDRCGDQKHISSESSAVADDDGMRAS